MFRLFLMLALLAMPTQRALALERPPEGSEVQLFIENDLLARTDRYYTNGIKFGGGMDFDLLQSPAAEVLRQLAPAAGGKVHLGLFVGQNLYTPRSITLAQAQPLDRPWAAWLYLGGVAQRIMQRGFKGGGKGWHICSPGTRRVCLSPLCRRTRTGVQVPDRTLFPFWPIPAGGAKGGNAQSFSE